MKRGSEHDFTKSKSSQDHHGLTHNMRNASVRACVQALDRFHIKQFADISIAGSAGGAIKTGHHTKYDPGTPISNLWLSMGRL